jgi:hypothetical protein
LDRSWRAKGNFFLKKTEAKRASLGPPTLSVPKIEFCFKNRVQRRVFKTGFRAYIKLCAYRKVSIYRKGCAYSKVCINRKLCAYRKVCAYQKYAPTEKVAPS